MSVRTVLSSFLLLLSIVNATQCAYDTTSLNQALRAAHQLVFQPGASLLTQYRDTYPQDTILYGECPPTANPWWPERSGRLDQVLTAGKLRVCSSAQVFTNNGGGIVVANCSLDNTCAQGTLGSNIEKALVDAIGQHYGVTLQIEQRITETSDQCFDWLLSGEVDALPTFWTAGKQWTNPAGQQLNRDVVFAKTCTLALTHTYVLATVQSGISTLAEALAVDASRVLVLDGVGSGVQFAHAAWGTGVTVVPSTAVALGLFAQDPTAFDVVYPVAVNALDLLPPEAAALAALFQLLPEAVAPEMVWSGFTRLPSQCACQDASWTVNFNNNAGCH